MPDIGTTVTVSHPSSGRVRGTVTAVHSTSFDIELTDSRRWRILDRTTHYEIEDLK